MDYGTLQTRVLNRLNMSTGDPAAGLVDEYVNEAIHYLETASPDGWSWMRQVITLTTTAATETYTFTTIGAIPSPTVTVSKILSAKILRGTVYIDLNMLSPADAVEVYPSTTDGVPEAWFVEGSTLYLYPTPDAVYSIVLRVVTAEPDISVSTTSPILPAVFHSAIVDAACLIYYEQLQDSAKMALLEQKVDRHIHRMQRYGRQYPSAPRIKVREWL